MKLSPLFIILTKLLTTNLYCQYIDTIYDKDKNIYQIIPYQNGFKNGVEFTYYKTGQILSKVKYKDNVIQGQKEFYYKDGALEMTVDYIDNVIHGFVSYHIYRPDTIIIDSITLYKIDTILLYKKQYQKGLLHGISYFYNSLGVLSRKVCYVNNVIRYHLADCDELTPIEKTNK